MSCDALYVHIPFCESKCPYCDFYSVKADGDLMDRYIGALEHALKTQPYKIQRLDTVYFGGGTPSALGGRRLTRLMDAVCRTFTVSPDAEITVECIPRWSRRCGRCAARESTACPLECRAPTTGSFARLVGAIRPGALHPPSKRPDSADLNIFRSI